MSYFAKYFSLQNFVSYGNQIYHTGTVYICNLLKITNTLKIINMDHNKIGDDGMFLISEGLQCNHTLTDLSVRNCGFSVEGNSNIRHTTTK